MIREFRTTPVPAIGALLPPSWGDLVSIDLSEVAVALPWPSAEDPVGTYVYLKGDKTSFLLKTDYRTFVLDWKLNSKRQTVG